MQTPWDGAAEADNVKCEGPEAAACHAHSSTSEDGHLPGVEGERKGKPRDKRRWPRSLRDVLRNHCKDLTSHQRSDMWWLTFWKDHITTM